MMDRVVVTGATSMVGVALLRECIRHGTRVLAVVRPHSAHADRLPESSLVTVCERELRELDALPIPDEMPWDAFYHLGWGGTDRADRLNPYSQAGNIEDTLRAVSLAERMGCRKFIGAGSQAEYGIHRQTQTRPDTAAEPVTAYGIAKLAAGRLAGLAAAKAGLDFSWVRIFSLYGENESPGTLIRTVIPKMLRNERCELTEGTQQWDYLYVADAAEAFYRIGERAAGSNVYCLGQGVSRPIREYLTEIQNALGSKSVLDFGAVPYELGVPNGICADISALTRDTGWIPRTSFPEGIREIVSNEYGPESKTSFPPSPESGRGKTSPCP